MPALRDDIDPDGLLEYSVVYTDRALNHMSFEFQSVMRDMSGMLKEAYSATSVAIVPGGGTYGMEAVARQFARNRRCMVLRNGWFSYRWSQILEAGNIPSSLQVLKASRQHDGDVEPFAPMPIAEVVAAIREYRPDVFFAPHVETSSGMLLPDDYLREIGTALQENGGLFVLDCIASGAAWVDIKENLVDVLISAPQKGWSGPSCAGLVMLGDKATALLPDTQSDSFACDLKKWHEIMQAYENGGHAYHATMPTDALRQARNTMRETRSMGFAEAHRRQLELGRRVRDMLAQRGLVSVAADGFEAPGVVVVYIDDPAIQSGSRFAAEGLQVAAGVPLMVDEGPGFRTVRMGLFGLDKLGDIDGTVARLENALVNVLSQREQLQPEPA